MGQAIVLFLNLDQETVDVCRTSISEQPGFSTFSVSRLTQSAERHVAACGRPSWLSPGPMRSSDQRFLHQS